MHHYNFGFHGKHTLGICFIETENQSMFQLFGYVFSVAHSSQTTYVVSALIFFQAVRIMMLVIWRRL